MNTRLRSVQLISKDVERIRNVCIVAHVDHGKTTMADALLSTNGIVSVRQSGKLRYMDNTDAEQERGITMKSSVISLVFNQSKNNTTLDNFLINLIDSPGHVDFSSEVSTAVRLCDTAIVVVDVVEGVCPQTRTVLRQAWDERLKLILILNKIDRLILELKLTPTLAYETICRVIEQVNSVLAEMFSADIMRREYNCGQSTEFNSELHSDTTVRYNWSSGLEKADDSNLYFSPEKGNVLFSSAIDSWGFGVTNFAQTWASRLSIDVTLLERQLWGDFYLVSHPQTVIKPNARNKNRKPIFVQLVLEPLWNVYQTLLINNERDKVVSMSEKLGVHLDKRAIRNVDSRSLVRVLLSSWLPLGFSIMQSVVNICPSPFRAISAERAIHMLYGDQVTFGCVSSPTFQQQQQAPVSVEQTSRLPVDSVYAQSGASLALQQCNSSAQSPTIAFVAKVFRTENSCLTSNVNCSTIKKSSFSSGHFRKIEYGSAFGAGGGSSGALYRTTIPVYGHCYLSLVFYFWFDSRSSEVSSVKECQLDATSRCSRDNPKLSLESADIFSTDCNFVALVRVFSGSISLGQKIFVLGPKFDSTKIPDSLLEADPSNLPNGPVRMPDESTDVHLDCYTEVAESHSFSYKSDSSSLIRRSGSRFLRHVYVASICHMFYLLGGHSDLADVVDPIPSGNIVGIGGSDLIRFVPKSGLLVSRLALVASGLQLAPILPLAGLTVWHGAPVISVAVELASLANPDDVYKLERGLRLLDRADPCAKIIINSSGEYIIRAAGEMHLQKCIEDLSKYFAPDVEIQISSFVVPFRETIVDLCTSNSPPIATLTRSSQDDAGTKLEDAPSQPADVQCIRSINNNNILNFPMSVFYLPHCKPKMRVLIRVTAHPLPTELAEWSQRCGFVKVGQLMRAFKNKSPNCAKLSNDLYDELSSICATLTSKCCSNSNNPIDWSHMASTLLALGPERSSPTMLFSRMSPNDFPLCTSWNSTLGCESKHILPLVSYGKALLRGFQTACQSGPLMGEPLHGILFVLEEIVGQKLCTSDANPSTVYPTTQCFRTNNKRLTSISWLDDHDLQDLSAIDDTANEDERQSEQSEDENSGDFSFDDGDDGVHDDAIVDDFSRQIEIKEKLFDSNADISYWQMCSDMDWLNNTPPGLLTSMMKRACLSAFEACPCQRLMMTMYDVEFQARSDVLGRMCGVLRRRHGRVLHEDFREGDNMFIISARLPVIESFGLSAEIRKRTSGIVDMPQLRPGGWELLDIDPLAKASSDKCDKKSSNALRIEKYHKKNLVSKRDCKDDDLEDKCGQGDDDSLQDESLAHVSRVQRYIRDIRKRKGLPLNEQLVISADKQRTLKKNK